MSDSPALDMRGWLYELVQSGNRGKRVGSSNNASAHGGNNNFTKTLGPGDEAIVMVRGVPLSLEEGTEVVVYQHFSPSRDGKWTYTGDRTLAAVFLVEDGKRVEQLTVKMNGYIARRRL